MKATSKLCLHVFAAASEIAYGAVIYGVRNSHEQNYSSFIVGKSRVIANKQKCWSIPRKELIATVTGANIVGMAIKVLGVAAHIEEIVLWTDSTTVLKWM